MPFFEAFFIRVVSSVINLAVLSIITGSHIIQLEISGMEMSQAFADFLKSFMLTALYLTGMRSTPYPDKNTFMSDLLCFCRGVVFARVVDGLNGDFIKI